MNATETNKRVIARALDLFSMSGFMMLGERLFDNVMVGFACGALYLLVGDGVGATWKTWFKLEATDARTGAACSVAQSAMRNVLWIVAPGLRMLIGQLFEPADPVSVIGRGVVGVIGLGITASLVVGFRRDGRHLGDTFAGTIVRAVPPKSTAP